MPLDIEFTTGSAILVSGIYRVHHALHRLPHEVVLIEGDLFPRCAKCSDAVSFTLIRQVQQGFQQGPIRLYELPVIEDGAAQAEAAS